MQAMLSYSTSSRHYWYTYGHPIIHSHPLPKLVQVPTIISHPDNCHLHCQPITQLLDLLNNTNPQHTLKILNLSYWPLNQVIIHSETSSLSMPCIISILLSHPYQNYGYVTIPSTRSMQPHFHAYQDTRPRRCTPTFENTQP